MNFMQITNEDIRRIAREQSAVDLNCHAEDFSKVAPVIVPSAAHPNARRYLKLPFFCNLVSYGNNVVASTALDAAVTVRDYLANYAPEHCFETPNMHVLNDAFLRYGHRICFMAEYFLPDISLLHGLSCAYELRILSAADFHSLYLPQWSNALCEARRVYDVLGIGAYDQGELIGLAACSADCETMWQIGVDVLPSYRRQGIAAALTSHLALEILQRGKVPFYCAAWSNLKSVGNALKSGFRPAWVEMTAKEQQFVDRMNTPKPE